MNDTTKKWLDDHSGQQFVDLIPEMKKLDWGDFMPVVDDELRFMGYGLDSDGVEALMNDRGLEFYPVNSVVWIEWEDALMAGLTFKKESQCWIISEGEDE